MLLSRNYMSSWQQNGLIIITNLIYLCCALSWTEVFLKDKKITHKCIILEELETKSIHFVHDADQWVVITLVINSPTVVRTGCSSCSSSFSCLTKQAWVGTSWCQLDSQLGSWQSALCSFTIDKSYGVLLMDFFSKWPVNSLYHRSVCFGHDFPFIHFGRERSSENYTPSEIWKHAGDGEVKCVGSSGF